MVEGQPASTRWPFAFKQSAGLLFYSIGTSLQHRSAVEEITDLQRNAPAVSEHISSLPEKTAEREQLIRAPPSTQSQTNNGWAVLGSNSEL